MTNEEAIKYYDRKLTICESHIAMCQESNNSELQCALHVYVSEHDRLAAVLSALREQAERDKGCDWCIGFCPDVTGDIYADYHFCPMCGRPLKEAQRE